MVLNDARRCMRSARSQGGTAMRSLPWPASVAGAATPAPPRSSSQPSSPSPPPFRSRGKVMCSTKTMEPGPRRTGLGAAGAAGVVPLLDLGLGKW
uniref:Uncharacterized protein n=1 Tax=Arundo donax TaxID=35708 RepID=A0A0A9FJ26_ARUDO